MSLKDGQVDGGYQARWREGAVEMGLQGPGTTVLPTLCGRYSAHSVLL